MENLQAACGATESADEEVPYTVNSVVDHACVSVSAKACDRSEQWVESSFDGPEVGDGGGLFALKFAEEGAECFIRQTQGPSFLYSEPEMVKRRSH